MSRTLAEVVETTEVAETEIVAWVEQHWVLPAEQGGQWLFDESDVARVSLIRELREDMDVNDDAMPVVLKLLDQVYGLRAAMQEMQEAIQGLPEEHRRALQERVQEVLNRHGQQV
jgi:chaperone modulatory protein CbpM